MFKGAKNREGAWRFMSWLMEDEPNLIYCKTLGLLPARQSIAERPEFAKDPILAGLHPVLPFLDRQPVPRPCRLGREARFRGRAAVPAGAWWGR